MNPDLVGRTYGPIGVVADPGSVAAFVTATGDHPKRWAMAAPPLFANALLFKAAPLFLRDPDVAPFTASLIHSEQEYQWSGALPIGSALDVEGRERQTLTAATPPPAS